MLNMRQEAKEKIQLFELLLERVRRNVEKAQKDLEILEAVRLKHKMTKEEELEEVKLRS